MWSRVFSAWRLCLWMSPWKTERESLRIGKPMTHRLCAWAWRKAGVYIIQNIHKHHIDEEEVWCPPLSCDAQSINLIKWCFLFSISVYKSSQRAKKVRLQHFFSPDKSSVTCLVYKSGCLYAGLVSGSLVVFSRADGKEFLSAVIAVWILIRGMNAENLVECFFFLALGKVKNPVWVAGVLLD